MSASRQGRLRGPARRRAHIVLSVLAALVTAGVATGCSNPINSIVGLTSGGHVSVGALPGNFPSDIPIADGKILAGTTDSDDVETDWVIAVVLPNATDADAVVSQLTGAGFTESDLNSAGNRFGTFDGKQFDIVGGAGLGFTRGDDQIILVIGVDHQHRTIAAYEVTRYAPSASDPAAPAAAG
ncbi:hypothetical protein [Subtercola sp. RTI3]|nr:hypothetical protein [Subtercola sp. RTI3]MEA9986041.1 hypothetical protein [Subtercola sp. RTI3]